MKCLGTDDRVPANDIARRVAASPTITPFVTFPGSEIKDLFVHETPAIPSVPTSHPPQPQASKTPQINDFSSAPASAPVKTSQPPKNENQIKKAIPATDSINNGPGKSRGPPSKSGIGTGEHLLKSRGKAQENISTEFDFNSGLSAFDKNAVFAEVATEKPIADAKYNKNDFFDTLTQDRSADGRNGRLTFKEEKKLNQDTFGISNLRRTGSYRGGRGGGRGGRGRSNGGGRGGRGYNNGNKSEVVA